MEVAKRRQQFQIQVLFLFLTIEWKKFKISVEKKKYPSRNLTIGSGGLVGGDMLRWAKG